MGSHVIGRHVNWRWLTKSLGDPAERTHPDIYSLRERVEVSIVRQRPIELNSGSQPIKRDSSQPACQHLCALQCRSNADLARAHCVCATFALPSTALKVLGWWRTELSNPTIS
jgi:hypothetical protein